MEYKARDIHNKFGLQTRRIQYIYDAGLVDCLDNPGRSPAGRTYSCDHVLEILLADELLGACALELARVKSVFKQIREHMPRMLQCFVHQNYDIGYFLEVFSDGTARMSTEKDFETLKRTNKFKVNLTDHTSAVVVNVSKLYDQIKEA